MKLNLREKIYFLLTFLLSISLISPNCLAAGGIVTDGTVGGINALHHTKALSGKNLFIPESLGTRHGGNLFHSFKDFNILAQQTVTFQENKPLSTENVITRVTGTSVSDINGKLVVTPGGNANFYFINPNGVTLGRGAQVNVPGSIHVSTADQIKLKDGQVFSAVQPGGNTLSSAAPAAFGFLETRSSNNGLLKIEGAMLKAKSFDGVAKKLHIEGSNNMQIMNGQIRLVAVNTPIEISVVPNNNGNMPLPNISATPENSGDIDLVNLYLQFSGDISIWGGKVLFRNAHLESKDSASTKKIDIHVNSLKLSGSRILAISSIKSPDIDVTAMNTLILDHGIIDTISDGGVSGNVTIKTGGDITVTGKPFFISPDLFTSSSGIFIETLTTSDNSKSVSGNLVIQTEGNININGKGASLATASTSFRNSDGGRMKGGDIYIYAAENLNVSNGGSIDSSIADLGKFKSNTITPGKISISVGGNIKLDGLTTLIGSPSLLTQGGVVVINNSGNTGDITLNAKGNIEVLNGARIDTQLKELNNNITSIGDHSNVKAGNISLNVGQNLNILNGGVITSGTSTKGNGGKVNIQVKGNFKIINRGEINSSTFAKGNGGAISVQAKNIDVIDSQISAESKSRNLGGKPGNVLIIATENLNLTRSAISVENKSESHNAKTSNIVNSLTVSASTINLKDSQITTRSTGNQPAGSITLNFKDALCLESSFITTESNEANGGDINIQGGELIKLENAGFKTTVHGIKGNGGNINVTADNLVMNTGLIQANTAARNAKGGNITLNVKALIPSGNQLITGGVVPIDWKRGIFGSNVIQAAAPSGLSGAISSTAPILNLSGELSNLGTPKFDTSVLNQNYCTTGTGSSLKRLGKGGFLPKGRDAWVY